MRKIETLTALLLLVIFAMSFTACDDDECEPKAPADIQEHLDQIAGKWLVVDRSSIFSEGSSMCNYRTDTAFITPTIQGFDVLIVRPAGTNCNTFIDSTLRVDNEVFAQHDGKFTYIDVNANRMVHKDVEVVLDTLSYNPPDDILIDTVLKGIEQPGRLTFELRRERE